MIVSDPEPEATPRERAAAWLKNVWIERGATSFPINPVIVRDLLEENRKLRTFLWHRQEEFAGEIERRRTRRGGQQAGVPKWAHAPFSLLRELEREFRHLLESL